MSLNLRDLKELELQELSDQESKAVTGGGKFGCGVGAVGSVLAGAATGALAGSAVPIIGTLGGAVIGGIAGVGLSPAGCESGSAAQDIINA